MRKTVSRFPAHRSAFPHPPVSGHGHQSQKLTQCFGFPSDPHNSPEESGRFISFIEMWGTLKDHRGQLPKLNPILPPTHQAPGPSPGSTPKPTLGIAAEG